MDIFLFKVPYYIEMNVSTFYAILSITISMPYYLFFNTGSHRPSKFLWMKTASLWQKMIDKVQQKMLIWWPEIFITLILWDCNVITSVSNNQSKKEIGYCLSDIFIN